MNINQLHNQHIWWRAGFGPAADQVHLLSRQKPDKLFHSLLKSSESQPVLFDVADPQSKQLIMGDQMQTAKKLMDLTPEQKQMIRKQSVLDIARLNIKWLQEMTESPAQLREKMS